MQQIDLQLWEDFQTQQKKAIKKLEQKAMTIHSGNRPKGSWTQKIVSKVRISDLATEFGITECPAAHKLYFDDSIGCFMCSYVKFRVKRCFSGNIVDFMQFCLEGTW